MRAGEPSYARSNTLGGGAQFHERQSVTIVIAAGRAQVDSFILSQFKCDNWKIESRRMKLPFERDHQVNLNCQFFFVTE